MSGEEIRELEKEVKKLKRISSEWAGKMHNLVEERLPAAYDEIPAPVAEKGPSSSPRRRLCRS